MSGDVVNLRQARKKRDRAAREDLAAHNRVRFGTRKGDRRVAEAERDRAERVLDGHRLGTEPDRDG